LRHQRRRQDSWEGFRRGGHIFNSFLVFALTCFAADVFPPHAAYRCSIYVFT
jgi:hypothetical protein